MDKIVLKDEAARDVIAKELDINLLVEAGAGSGKTQEMANRILALINSGYRKINEIVAITFTKKAANELRERIRTTLESEYAKSGQEQDKEQDKEQSQEQDKEQDKGQRQAQSQNQEQSQAQAQRRELQKAALDHIHECFIGTIHSFCGKILRERPIEAGVDPGFEEIDDAKDQMILRDTWEAYVSQADDNDKRILNLMDTFGVREVSAKAFLQKVCEQQDVNFQLPDEDVVEPEEIFEKIRDVLTEVYDLVEANYSAIPDDVIKGKSNADGLQKSMIRFRKKVRSTKLAELPNKALVDLLMIFLAKTSVGVTQNRWSDDKALKERAKSLGLQFYDFRETSVVPLIKTINASVYNHLLIPFMLKAAGIYTQHKRAVAELNFQDLLMMTSRLLCEFPEVRIYFQSKYKTLLIDEFQDTDPIQTEIAMYLTGVETGEKVWHKITPREGSLFVVGDPKQSIYKFRRADFNLYKRFKEHIVSGGGKVIELHTNFRSTDELGAWYDAAFAELLSGDDQADFKEMDTVMPSLDDTLTGVAYYRLDAKNKERVIDADPIALTHIINHLVSEKEITIRKINGDGNPVLDKRPVKFKDIMVLARKKSLLEPIANSVAASGIPVRITGADITKRTSEFTSFADLIKMLAYPDENAYVYSVMRGNFFGFTSKEIYRYRNRGGEFSIYFDFDSFFEKNPLKDGIRKIFENVRDCFLKLQRFSGYIQNLSPAAATERIIEDLGIMRIHLTSNEKLAGFGSFVSLIEKIRMKKVTDIWGLNLFMDELMFMIEGGFEEDIDIEGKDVDAVRFMNVHKAKGLEAPVIILCGPCSGKVPDPTFFTELVEKDDGSEENLGYIRVNKNPDSFQKTYFEPFGWYDIEEKALAAEELERDRLLYVAATRARNYLVISDSAARDRPWDKLVQLLPDDKVNLLDEVYSEDEDDDSSRDSVVSSKGVGADTNGAGDACDAGATDVDASGAGDACDAGDTALDNTDAGAAFLSTEDSDKELATIKKRRDDAFNANKATYRMYKPSSSQVRATNDEPGSTPGTPPIGTSTNQPGTPPDSTPDTQPVGTPTTQPGSENQDHELEKSITENTMEVVIYGEEAIIKADKLSIGIIIHKIFEVLITNEPELQKTIELILKENRDDYITEKFLQSIVSEFKGKPLWTRIQKSEKVYTEVPFSYKALKNETYASDTMPEDTYINGIIDLVFKEDDGWVIIDYKSYNEHEVSHEIHKAHEPQLESYKDAWEKITGEPVKETSIFFVRKRVIE